MIKKSITLLLIIMLVTITFSQRYGESDDFSYALKLFNEGFYDIAAQQFQVFLERYPNSERVPDAKYYLALSYYNVQDFERARIEFQSLAVGYPDHNRAPDAWQKVGESYQKLNKPAAAAKAFETVKVLYPEDPNAPPSLYEAANVYFNNGQLKQAESTLQDFLDRYPASALYAKGRLLYARILMQEQNFDQAFKEFQKVLESDASSDVLATAHVGLGEFYQNLGQMEKAKSEYDLVLTQFSSTDAVYQAILKYTDLLANTQDFEKATSLISKNLNRFKDRRQQAELNLKLAAIYFLQENFLSARKILESLQPDMLNDSLAARTYFYLGNVYTAEEKFQQSLSAFDKLLDSKELKTGGKRYIPETQKQIGYTLLKSDQFLRAQDQLTQYIKNYPEDNNTGRLLVDLFYAALKNRNSRIAEEVYHQLLKNYPNHPKRDDMLFKLGSYYFQNNNFSESQSKFQQFIQDYYASAKYDSAKQHLNLIRNFYNTNQNVGVNKLARLIGRILSDENTQVLKLELAKIYLHELRNIEEAIQLSESIVHSSTDSTSLAEAYFLLGESYWRLAQKKAFEGNINSFEIEEAQANLKNAMSYINAFEAKDSLTFKFLQLTAQDPFAGEMPVDRKIKFWEHFISNYQNSKFLDRGKLVLAEIYESIGNTDKAVTYLNAVLQSSNTNLSGDAYFSLGNLYYAQGDFQKAAEYLKEYLLKTSIHPHRAEAFALLAKMREGQEMYDEAAQFWARLSQQYDYTSVAEQAKDRIPQIYLKAGKYQAVLDYTKPYISNIFHKDILLRHLNKIENPKFLFYSGKAYFQLDRYSKARQELMGYIFNTANQTYSDESLMLLADISIEEGDMDAAVLHLQLVAKNEDSPFFIQANAKIADIYFEQQKYDKAQALYAKLIPQVDDPEQQVRFRAREMISLINQGRLSAFNSKLSIFKKQHDSHNEYRNYRANFEFEIGKYYYENKNFDSAIDKFENVADDYKKSEFADDAEYYLGLTYTTLNKVEKAQDILTAFAEKYPNSILKPNIYVTLGGLYYRAEKQNLAVGAFKRAVEMAQEPSTRKVALSNLISLYQDLGLWDGVLNQSRTYVEEFPEADDVMDKKILIGTSLSRLNRYTEAVEYLRKLKFRANSEQEPEIQFYIGEAYFNAGQYQNAIRELVKIPLLSKQTKLQWEASALYYSGQAYEKLGRREDAIRMYQEIIDRPGIMVELKREARKKIDQLKNAG